MSMLHRAFALDWRSFEFELHPQLVLALETDDPTELIDFIRAERPRLLHPDTHQPLPPDWTPDGESLQSLADIALTRFYNPHNDRGVGTAWLDLYQRLSEDQGTRLLGFTVRCDDGGEFDPCCLGSYFQTPAQVRESLAILAGIKDDDLREFVDLLGECVKKCMGLYATF